MTYELAKQLKDAGYKLKLSHGPDDLRGVIRVDETWYLIPSLSELIEACGDRFVILTRIDRFGQSVEQWIAIGTHHEERKGFTPEEAVAHLWLALNAS